MNSGIKEELRSIVENKIGRRFNETDELSGLGLNSIDFVELVVQVENHFSIFFLQKNLQLHQLVILTNF